MQIQMLLYMYGYQQRRKAMKLKLSLAKKSAKKSATKSAPTRKSVSVSVEYAFISGVGDVDYDSKTDKWGFFSKGRWQYLPAKVQSKCESLADMLYEQYGSSGYPESCEPYINFKTRKETWFE
jgi:hypothetical protein